MPLLRVTLDVLKTTVKERPQTIKGQLCQNTETVLLSL